MFQTIDQMVSWGYHSLLQSIANDLKRPLDVLAKELNFDYKKLQRLVKGNGYNYEYLHLIDSIYNKYPIALSDLYVEENDTKDGIIFYNKDKYIDRLNYEISIINKTGYSGYFLIVSDFISWAKKQNIPVGPGRGSGAGSLVAWTIGITDLDPIEYGLIFERFLNPDRVTLPDFDIDFCQEKRDEVLKYVVKKYGKKKVSQIITFGSLPFITESTWKRNS